MSKKQLEVYYFSFVTHVRIHMFTHGYMYTHICRHTYLCCIYIGPATIAFPSQF